jgi:acid phosphatase type 7
MLARLSALVLGFAVATPALAAPAQVHLGFEGPTDTTVTVTWRSTEATGAVTFGETTAYGRTAAAVSVAYGGSWLHEARLGGLAPGTTYHYRAGAGASLTPDRTFTTGPARSARAAFRFAAYGDSRTDDAARARVRAAVQARQPAFSVDSGDLVEDGSRQALWDEWFATMEPLLATTPFVSVVGNHEVNSALFYQQFALPRRSAAADGETYASWHYGNVHFLSLNTEIPYGAGSAQYAWLEADLARAAADPAVRWIIATLHRPPYSSGNHGSELGVREAWSPLFERYGVAVVFSGHDHHYERSLAFANGVPQRDGGGVVYVVTGGAGAPLYGVTGSAFTAFSRSIHHFVQVDVTATALALQAIDSNGNVIDRVTLVNGAPLPAEVPLPQQTPPAAPVADDPTTPATPAPETPASSPGGLPSTLGADATRSGGCGVAGGGGALTSALALVAACAGGQRRAGAERHAVTLRTRSGSRWATGARATGHGRRDTGT